MSPIAPRFSASKVLRSKPLSAIWKSTRPTNSRPRTQLRPISAFNLSSRCSNSWFTPRAPVLNINEVLSLLGTIEILPMETALTVFAWSKSRVTPVRITDLSITEDAFDTNLNPIRAKVSLGMRVLSVSDVGFLSPAGAMYMIYQTTKEALAQQA